VNSLKKSVTTTRDTSHN